MPPHYVNCAHFCGGKAQYEYVVEGLVMAFYRDHQVAHELSNRAASKLQNAFIADRQGDLAAATAYYGEAVGLLEETIQQWDIVVASSTSLQAYLPDRLRPEFVQLMTAMDTKTLNANLQSSGNSPRGLNQPFEEVSQILSAGGESSIISLFSTNLSKVNEIKDLTVRIHKVLVGLQSFVSQGKLWDEVVPHSFLVKKKKHELIDLDEQYFAALMSHAFFLEAISQMSREALLNSNIPYEECQSKRKKQP